MREYIFDAVGRALAEDVGRADITVKAIFPRAVKIKAAIVAKQKGVLAGIETAMASFKLLDPGIKFMPALLDGGRFKPDTTIAYIEGDAAPILSAERTALNFLSHLSGIATLTSEFVEKVKPYKVRIMDTRKTMPGLRFIEKSAVSSGGGTNHRMGLFDQVLIKDNHLKATGYDWRLISRVINECRKKKIKVEVEVETLQQFNEALKINPDIIMLDNIKISDIKKAVSLKSKNRGLKTRLEASGGINLGNVRKIASTGVDMISVGALTHSAKPIDFSLEIIKR